LIVDGSVKAEAIAANAVTADKVNVTDLAAISANMGTITAGSISSALITGDVTEVYPFSQFYYSTLTGTATEQGSFSIPAPTNGIAKRNKIDINVTLRIENSTQAPTAQTAFQLGIQKKSKGGASTEVSNTGNKVVVEGTVAAVYQQLISLDGNQLEKVDVNGGVAASNDASGTYEPASISSLYYDAVADKTYFQVSSLPSSPTFANGDDLYFSEDKFTSSGTWVSSTVSSYNYSIATPPSNGYVTLVFPYKSSYGLTTTASNFRLMAGISTPQANVIYRLDVASGTLENIS
jgi:hypothetical protein